MVGLFAMFILACGTTHLVSIYVLWVPAYGLEAAIKVLTALASIATAVLLVPLLPRLIALALANPASGRQPQLVPNRRNASGPPRCSASRRSWRRSAS